MLVFLTFAPTFIGLALMAIFVAVGKVVDFHTFEWLFLQGQVIFLAFGAVAVLLKQKNADPLPSWRAVANKWIGRTMAVCGLFYAIAFF